MKKEFSVVLLGHNYDVFTASEKEIAAETLKIDADGVCHFDSQRIFIRENASSDRQDESLIHEILHVLVEAIQSSIKDSEEEIHRLARALFASGFCISEFSKIFPEEQE